jgi:hypothetical protein
MSLLTREQILAADDIITEKVQVDGWGGEVLVRGMTGAERDRVEKTLVELKGKRIVMKDDIRAKLVAASVVDEKGELLFSEGDIHTLAAKSAAALQKVFEVAQRLSGLTDEDVDELEKN